MPASIPKITTYVRRFWPSVLCPPVPCTMCHVTTCMHGHLNPRPEFSIISHVGCHCARLRANKTHARYYFRIPSCCCSGLRPEKLLLLFQWSMLAAIGGVLVVVMASGALYWRYRQNQMRDQVRRLVSFGRSPGQIHNLSCLLLL